MLGTWLQVGDAYETLKLILAPLVAVLMAMIGLIAKLWRDSSINSKTADAAKSGLERHERECAIRHEANARLTESVANIGQDVASLQKQATWVGDCIIGIGAKLDVKLPERHR